MTSKETLAAGSNAQEEKQCIANLAVMAIPNEVTAVLGISKNDENEELSFSFDSLLSDSDTDESKNSLFDEKLFTKIDEKSQLTKQITCLESEKEQLLNDLSELSQCSLQITQVNKELQNQLSTSKSAYKFQISELQESLQKQVNTTNESNAQISKLKTENLTFRCQLETLVSQVNQNNLSNQKTQELQQQLSSFHDAHTSEVNRLNHIINTKNLEISNLKTMKTVSSDKDDSKQLINDLANQLSRQQTWMKSADIKIEDYQEQLKTADIEIQKLNEQIKNITNDFKKEIDEQSATIHSLTVRKENAEEHISKLEQTIVKAGHTEQTIKLNQPKEFRSFKSKVGLGAENIRPLEKAADVLPTLYNYDYMNLGIWQSFLHMPDEEAEVEKFNREKEEYAQISFNYDALNSTYEKKKAKFENNEYFPIVTPEEFSISDNEVLKQTIEPKLYVPTLILEKKIVQLESEIDETHKAFDKEKEKLQTKIHKLEDTILELKHKTNENVFQNSKSSLIGPAPVNPVPITLRRTSNSPPLNVSFRKLEPQSKEPKPNRVKGDVQSKKPSSSKSSTLKKSRPYTSSVSSSTVKMNCNNSKNFTSPAIAFGTVYDASVYRPVNYSPDFGNVCVKSEKLGKKILRDKSTNKQISQNDDRFFVKLNAPCGLKINVFHKSGKIIKSCKTCFPQACRKSVSRPPEPNQKGSSSHASKHTKCSSKTPPNSDKYSSTRRQVFRGNSAPKSKSSGSSNIDNKTSTKSSTFVKYTWIKNEKSHWIIQSSEKSLKWVVKSTTSELPPCSSPKL